jgi:putative aldouronate transport system permease protein
LSLTETSRHPRLSAFLRSPRTHLFLSALPFAALVFVFAYLPLYGWLYALYDYRPGIPLLENEFTGLRFFSALFDSPIQLRETIRVMRNTFAISFLQIFASPLPVLFAIFLNEMRSSRFKKFVQTTTTLPNFISWVLVFAVFFAMFSVEDGFVNRVLLRVGLISEPANVLASRTNVWLFQTGVTIWKTLGWNAIIYLAAIAGIDPQLYEAAYVDGAGRIRSIWHITVPGIMPTYFVLLLLQVANIINNGVEQYFVFMNPMTRNMIEVLDLYVYNQGIAGVNYSLATAISVLKSLVGISLLLTINKLSKVVRGHSLF